MDLLHLILSVFPICFFCIFLLFSRSLSLLKISLITLILTFIIAASFWHLPFISIIFYSSKGFFIALDIFFIIFGAILFLDVLKKNKIIESLAIHLDRFSPDFRIQVIMLAWFFENFLEGIAGFGTPSTIVAPLLIALGISPFKAVIIALLGNSTSVPFGAVGTPIRVGFAGLNIDFNSIGTQTAIYNFVGILVPIFMLFVLVSNSKNRRSDFFKALPFAIWSGIAFVVPAYFVSLFGIEFPSIIGSIIGIVLIIITSRLGFLIPRHIYPSPNKIKTKNNLTISKTIFPYFLFIILLIFGKIFFSKLSINIPFISHSINLFNPGFVFIIATIIFIIYSKINFKNIFSTSSTAFKKSMEPFLVTAAISAVVQIMNNSSNISLNLVSMTQTFSSLFKTNFLPFISPFIGTLGSFITGSATVSDIMFGSSIYLSSLSLNMDPIKNLALALAGAGAGNMIAISDVLVAKTVAKSTDSLRKIIISLLPFCLIYLILISLLSLFV